MGKLLSFLGGAAKSLANTLDQDRLEQKRIEDDERQFAKQVSWAKAAEAIRANMQTKTAIPTPSPFGSPIKNESGNWVQPTKTPVGALLDEQTGDVVRPAALKDGPSLPAADPYALKPYEAAKLEDNKLNRESREKAARIRASGGGSGNGSAKVRTVTNSDGSKTDYDPNTGDELKHYPAKGGGAGGMTEKGWREGMDSTLSSIQGAEAGKLKSIIRQYGGDNQVIMEGEDAAGDLENLRETAFAVAETYWNERKPSGKKASEPEPKKADSPPVAGAKKAPDGFWYVQQNGKWFKVD